MFTIIKKKKVWIPGLILLTATVWFFMKKSGSENIIFTQRLNERNILWENACNLVLLSTNQYQS